jgi:hypothetical protein
MEGKGKDNKGANKKQVSVMIAELINKSDLVVEHDDKQVTSQ